MIIDGTRFNPQASAAVAATAAGVNIVRVLYPQNTGHFC